jgi:cation transport ATPase
MPIQQDFQNSFAKFNQKTQNSLFTSFQSSSDQESLLDSISNRASSALGSFSYSSASSDSECFGISSMQRYLIFGLMLGASAMFFMISFFTLPMLLLNPGKFALSYTIASVLFLGSWSVLNGWRAHMKHLFAKEKLAFTLVYLVSLVCTLYFSVISPLYIPVLLFTIIQLVSLIWYLTSYLPVGGLSWFARSSINLPV